MAASEQGRPRSEELVERDREAWNLPSPPLVPVGPAREARPADETDDRPDEDVVEAEPGA